MRLLLDQGLPRSTALAITVQNKVLQVIEEGLEAEHVGDIGLAGADDRTILAHALGHDQIVVTLDADFHAQLALSGARGPSVIRIRVEGLKAEPLAGLLVAVVERCEGDLRSGAMITVTESSVRVRRLPLVR